GFAARSAALLLQVVDAPPQNALILQPSPAQLPSWLSGRFVLRRGHAKRVRAEQIDWLRAPSQSAHSKRLPIPPVYRLPGRREEGAGETSASPTAFVSCSSRAATLTVSPRTVNSSRVSSPTAPQNASPACKP